MTSTSTILGVVGVKAHCDLDSASIRLLPQPLEAPYQRYKNY